jgi:hypothetical protein
LDFLACLTATSCIGGGCAPHRTGPLCAICENGFTQATFGAECTACPSRSGAVGGTVGFSLLIALAVVVVCDLPLLPYQLKRHYQTATAHCQVFMFVWRSEGLDARVVQPYQHVDGYTEESRAANYQVRSLCPTAWHLTLLASARGLVGLVWFGSVRFGLVWFGVRSAT